MKRNFYNRIYIQSNSTLQRDLNATVTDRKFKVANFSVSMTYFLVPWIITVALSKKINWALIALHVFVLGSYFSIRGNGVTNP